MHTAVSVGCLAAGTEAVIRTQCQGRSEVTAEPEGKAKVPIIFFLSLLSLLFTFTASHKQKS